MTEQSESPEQETPAEASTATSADAVPAEPALSPPEPPPESAWSAPSSGDSVGFSGASAPAGSDRPEIAAGAAFAGGFVLAMILKRLAR